MIPLTKENIKKALIELHSYEADLGGTVIAPALRNSYGELFGKSQGSSMSQ